MANALNDIVHSIFGEPERIGYELLQNADDAAAPQSGLSIDIKFFLLEKYLVVSHNGRHFSNNNVEALCRYGATETEIVEDEKQHDIDKIGYKGIGFKSVFNIADRVWVLSDDYTFCFDKSHWNGKAIPWQIVPVFTSWEELPDDVSKAVDKNRVNFVMEIKEGLDRTLIRRKMAKVFAHENIILFLRHTRSLELLYEGNGGILPYRKLVRSLNDPVFTLEKFENGKLTETTRWHVTTFQVPVLKETRDSLTHLDKRLCPEKLKTAERIEISFAAKLREDNSVIPLDRPKIFSYLPTETHHAFPFLVNSNFLMNEARTELLNGTWNEFLFEQIGYLQFKWFRQMAKTESFRFEFAELLVKYAETTAERRNQRLNVGAKRAQTEIAFVPVLQSEELKKAPETIVDKTRFSDRLEEYQLVKDSFESNIQYEIADPRIKKIEGLLKVGAAKFDPQKLRDTIRKGGSFTSVSDNMRLVNFFHKKLEEVKDTNERSEWMQVLRETPFLLEQGGAMKEPRELYFPTSSPELPFELPMAFLNKEVFDQAVTNNTPLKNWLEKLGLVFPKPAEIIRRGIFTLIDEDKIAHSNAIAIGRYIFKNQDGLTSEDFQKLSHLFLLTTKSSLQRAAFCYLSDVFAPKLPLETLLDEDIFVSPTYLMDGEEPEAWNRFLSKLGARQEMELQLKEDYYEFHKLKPRYSEYLNFLGPHLPSFNPKAAHNIYTFLLPLYIQYADRPEFSKAYWKILLKEKWAELSQKSSRARFVQGNNKSPIPSYFQFLVQTKPFFPAEDGMCYPTTKIFSTSLAQLIGDWAPVSFFDLQPRQEKLFGIRSDLHLEDCLSILSDAADKPEQLDKERITALYKYLLTLRLQSEDIQANPLFSPDFKLLAVNNTFQPVSQLFFLHIPRFAEKSDASHFVFLDLPDEDAIEFCRLFGLHVIGLEDLERRFERSEELDNLKPNWKSKLPFIAKVSASKKGRPYPQEFERLKESLKDIPFCPSVILSITYQKESEMIYQKEVKAWYEEKSIHFLQDWQNPQVLYDLQYVLAECFDLEGCEPELQVLLSTKIEEIPDWLTGQGYDVGGDEIIEPPIETSEVSKAVVKPPLPTPIIKSPTSKAIMATPKEIKPKEQSLSNNIEKDDAEKIGRWGEEYVKGKEIIENYYGEKGIAFGVIVWMNKESESGSPFDFKVMLENGEVHFWEVKATPSITKAEFPISGNEFRYAEQKQEHYFIIRILAAGTETPDCKILQNPIQLIKDGIIKINELKMEFIG